ncbi:HAD hydrolase family protein [Herbidospora sp. NEAU-GS84]|uniref:HAD hydrolase family protein n=1 Tax=Herbidospora solisilvae TaxID=2696284 RepID=A0A7C9JD70_9ACTN|nr:HAD family hydrolase [Herbidospora solisilvae]NAS22083.1 HAD hydrolase family protein [Herbidospora solisilvae]
MAPPRLVATDLDGTALRSDGTISARTAAAFAAVEDSGATLVFVTARPPRWMTTVSHVVNHRGLAICANGALLYDLHTESIADSHLMPSEVVAETVALLRAAVPSLTFSVEYEDGYAYETGFPLGGWDLRFGDGRPPVASVLGLPCAKLLAYHHTMDADDLYEQVVALVGGLVTPTHSSGRALIEMSALGVTKATALARFAERNGIAPGEAVAFGDMPNDLPMLGWAGTSVAVSNAHPDVLAAVDQVTAANDDDGVALVLERLYGGASAA